MNRSRFLYIHALTYAFSCISIYIYTTSDGYRYLCTAHTGRAITIATCIAAVATVLPLPISDSDRYTWHCIHVLAGAMPGELSGLE